ncbi:MAG: hypothetical protein R3C59_00645 [Planctomycetaceae bacterium]
MTKITSPVRPLADVNVLGLEDGDYEVVVNILPTDIEDIVGEGELKTALAMDASRSMKPMFGGSSVFDEDPQPNLVQAVTRKLAGLITDMTQDSIEIFYWALDKGEGLEQVGTFDRSTVAKASISGPKKRRWGVGTHLLPTIRYFAETIDKGSDWTFGVIITDGLIQDEQACVDYCMKLGRRIAADVESGRRRDNSFKLVLIGVGAEVDQDQLERFDDMFEGTDLEESIDLWSHGVASSMQQESDIMNVLFGELASEAQIVAASAVILDAQGQELASFTDGLPGRFRFVLPNGNRSFTVKTPKSEVTQDISEAV